MCVFYTYLIARTLRTNYGAGNKKEYRVSFPHEVRDLNPIYVLKVQVIDCP
jgi:hypothetical protein